MIQNNESVVINKKQGYQRIVVILIFLAGFLNASTYLKFMGFHIINKGILLLFYSLLAFMLFITVLNSLFRKDSACSSFGYWIMLAIAIMLKLFSLFIQFPSAFFPGGVYFNELLTFSSNLLLMIVLIKSIHSVDYLKIVIWAFGLGASFSAIIPFLFFPEMIGSRVSLVNNYTFSGAFWNSAVVSYMSVGWLLLAVSIRESSILKKGILLGMFAIITLGALAGLSRATLLSILFSAIVYLIVSKKIKQYAKVIVAIIGLSFILLIFFPDVIENFEQRLDGGINVQDETRTIIWKDYLDNIPDYVFLGEIKGNFKKYSPGGYGPHSVLLNWFVQFGILAAIGFIILMIGVLNSIKTVRRKSSVQISAALYGWLAAYLSIAMINETGFKDLTVFGAIGIVLAWGNIVKKEDFEITKKG